MKGGTLLKNRNLCKEFYRFFIANEHLSNPALAVLISKKYAGITPVLALDLIVSTRHAMNVSENLVERIQK